MDELTGTMALVNPLLTSDPIQRQGQIGIIASTNLDKDEVYVGFGKGPLSVYSTDALLVLKPHNQLYQDLLTNVKELEKQDFKNLLRVSMLIQPAASPNQLKEALQLAGSNEKTLAFSTVPLNEKLGISREQDVQTAKTIGR